MVWVISYLVLHFPPSIHNQVNKGGYLGVGELARGVASSVEVRLDGVHVALDDAHARRQPRPVGRRLAHAPSQLPHPPLVVVVVGAAAVLQRRQRPLHMLLLLKDGMWVALLRRGRLQGRRRRGSFLRIDDHK